MKELFTKEFLSSLKNEISQRVKPSKSILEALKHANLLAQNYKVLLFSLRKRSKLFKTPSQHFQLKTEHYANLP